MNILTPYISLVIDDLIFLEVVRFDYVSGREDPIDIVNIEVSGQVEDEIVQHEATIVAGYREGPITGLMAGIVKDVKKLDMGMQIKIKDQGIMLKNTTISKTYKKVSADQIVRDIVNQAGITKTDIQTTTQKKRIFVIPEMTCIEAIRLVNQTYNLDHQFYFQMDTFIWKPWAAENDEGYVFETGENIIDLEYWQNDEGILKTVFIPDLKHSQVIRIIDYLKGIDFRARVEKMQVRFGDENIEDINWTKL